ncbi:MAG: aminotransferase class III-fold pyridoxal phosphate-dependent enzyme [Albidovulum sp.]|nr:aminotransferase class III-fold pyridoxal phosphate-dependent enzyme [Albidovulum sp.]
MTAKSIFDRSPPNFQVEELRAIAARHFGIGGVKITPLDSERDQNAKIEADSGTYVLKIANAGENSGVLAMQCAVLHHLEQVAPAIRVPRIVSARDGADIVKVRRGRDEFLVRVVTFLHGPLVGSVPATPKLARSLGSFLGKFSRAMQGFGHPACHRSDFLWNLDSVTRVSEFVDDIENDNARINCRYGLLRYDSFLAGRLPRLRMATIHQDANDNNVVLSDSNNSEIAGIFDFGDMVFGRQINELAVAMAYILLNAKDLWGTASEIVAGYASEFPLVEQEIEVLFDLMRLRLIMSVCISSRRARLFPDNSYLRISQAPAEALLTRLATVDEGLAEMAFRDAAGFSPAGHHSEILNWLESGGSTPASLSGFDVGSARRFVVSAAKRSDLSGAYDWNEIGELVSEFNAEIGFGLPPDKISEMSPHTGWLDIFLPVGSAVRALFEGEVVQAGKEEASGKAAQRIAIQHSADRGNSLFYTSYEFPRNNSCSEFSSGDRVNAGDVIGRVASETGYNFGICRLRCSSTVFQVLGMDTCDPVLRAALAKTRLDPRPILKTGIGKAYCDSRSKEALLGRRRRVLGPSLSLAYDDCLHIVSGNGTYLVDSEGRRYLDCVNNVAHVGHSHPDVAKAVAEQARLLNSNTRYLSETRLDYAERLAGELPAPLSVIYLVCTGSEANELALRIARSHTMRRGIIVLDWAYHGNTTSLVEISPYKFKRRGGFAEPAHVEVAEIPNRTGGGSNCAENDAGAASSRSVAECIARLRKKSGMGPAAFFAESVAGVAGQIFYPQNFLKSAFEYVRDDGGLCIADEVQCGFGRLGECFWGFEYQDAVPDILTFGKPAGNGFPLAGVATTPEISASFANGMEYFNSFGGNQVSAAAGLSVLAALEKENLLENALGTGRYLKQGLRALAKKFEIIGDVRGIGLFLGIELVENRRSFLPAGDAASRVSNAMRANGVLVSTDGPHENVLKIKPPLCFGRIEADLLCDVFAEALSQERF